MSILKKKENAQSIWALKKFYSYCQILSNCFKLPLPEHLSQHYMVSNVVNLWQSDRWKHLIVLICISLVINIILHRFIDFDIFSLWVKRHVFCSFFCQWFILFLKWLWEYLYTKKERAFNGFFVVVQEILVFLMIPKNLSTQSRRKMLLTFKEQWVSPKMERGGVVCR